MNAVICFLFGWLSTLTLYQSEIRLPNHKADNKIYSSIKKFIPKKYVVLDQANGDLNGDGVQDKILLLRLKHEITEEEQRPVLILLGLKNNKYRKIAENINIVLSLGDGGIHGDPYHGVTIKNGYFSIEHFGGSSWRWNQVITFKYSKQKQNWFLYKIGEESWHMNPTSNFIGSYKFPKDFGQVLFVNYKNALRDKN